MVKMCVIVDMVPFFFFFLRRLRDFGRSLRRPYFITVKGRAVNVSFCHRKVFRAEDFELCGFLET